MADEDLLRPTLSGHRKPPSLYSSSGWFLAAFFGGPVAACLYAGANSWRLGRLQRDLALFVAIAAVAFLALIEFERWGGLRQLAGYLGMTPAGTRRICLRAMGLACFGAIYLMHRGFFRAAAVSGAKSLPSWIPGIAAVLIGYAANVAFGVWIQHH